MNCIHGKRMNEYRNGKLIRGEDCAKCDERSLLEELEPPELCPVCGKPIASLPR